jgi:glucosamine kinase
MSNTRSLIIGIDGGQTSTKSVLVDGAGAVLGHGSGGGLRHMSADGSHAQFVQAISAAVRSAFADARIAEQPLAGIGLGLTGVESPDAPEATAVRALVPQVVVAGVVALHSDAYAALIGAHEGRPGVIAISGTGSHILGVGQQGELARAGGWGWLIGDEGGAMWLGRSAVAAAVRYRDGWGEMTTLLDRILAHYGISDIHQIKTIMYATGFGARGFALLSALVSDAARDGDAVAVRLIEQAARDLAEQVRAVCSRLTLPNPAPLAPIGGTFAHVHNLQAAFESALAAVCSGVRVQAALHEPAMGAALMAQRLLNR